MHTYTLAARTLAVFSQVLFKKFVDITELEASVWNSYCQCHRHHFNTCGFWENEKKVLWVFNLEAIADDQHAAVYHQQAVLVGRITFRMIRNFAIS